MQNIVNLAVLKPGERVKISHLDTILLPAKFYELGFIPGSTVEIQHKAPLNGPICVHILDMDSLIAIRKSEAQLIFAEKLS